ncbi:hypothetical protein [Streptomyces sp. NPDC001076]
MDDRPKHLDDLLAHVADNLTGDMAATSPIASPAEVLADQEQQSTKRARALLAPLEQKFRELEARKRAELRGGMLTAAAEHLRTTLFPAVYEDAGQRTAEGVIRAADELLRLVENPDILTVVKPPAPDPS